jgi:hypothetical protein
MLDNLKVEDIMFLDIETVPESSSFEMLNAAMQNLWEKKSRQFRAPDQTAQDVYERAGIYSEFGKIICISVGFIRGKNPFSFRLKSFFGKDEKSLLSEFSVMLSKFSRTN